ncbi:MAG: phosphoribosylamine--glycine ligase [Bacteroidales bacterium]|nr:phosphoribosylamine--glycine ligase [Bacteroidales bacterium]
MNILLLGSGGREHAIAWKLSQSNKIGKLFIAPGNAGTSEVGVNVQLEISNFSSVKEFVLENKVEMVIVGPEQPLVDGIADYFLSNDDIKEIPVIGPVKAGALLEGSKDFAKEFMSKYNIPTAKYMSFTKATLDEGKKFLETLSTPYVLKADGLAAGKGVLILTDLNEAKNSLAEMLGGQFGEASEKVVIEEFLDGIELSVFVITDGKSYKILPEAKDYKRIGEGDTGLNTGGMGAVSPVPFADKSFMDKVERKVIQPTIDGIRKEGINYKGFVFLGLIKVDDEPYVIEYNVRMGDPETEVVIPRIKSDLLDLFIHVGNETLDKVHFEIDDRSCTTVMLVSGGYPEEYEKGMLITGFDKIEKSFLFHAGTKESNDGTETNGGRVIAISSYGVDHKEALKMCYENALKVDFKGKYYRKDIGFDLN